MAKKAPHPHATLLFTDWTLSEEGQKVLALELGKGVAMTGLPVKYKSFKSSLTMSLPLTLAISSNNTWRSSRKFWAIAEDDRASASLRLAGRATIS